MAELIREREIECAWSIKRSGFIPSFFLFLNPKSAEDTDVFHCVVVEIIDTMVSANRAHFFVHCLVYLVFVSLPEFMGDWTKRKNNKKNVKRPWLTSLCQHMETEWI